MKSFRDHLNEEVLPTVQVADGGLDIDKPAVRAAINAAIAGVVSQPAVTPYVVFNRLSKLLAQYHIVLPKRFLEGDKGVEVFELKQFGHRMGMTDSGEFVNHVPSTHYLFLQYGIITPMGVTYAKPIVGGMFRVTARLVDKAELDRLMDMAEITMSEEAECMQAIYKANAPKEEMPDITSDKKKKGNEKAVADSEKGLEEENDLKGACWKGYTAKGLKKKGNRMVPNCVPVEESTDKDRELSKIASKAISKGHPVKKLPAGRAEYAVLPKRSMPKGLNIEKGRWSGHGSFNEEQLDELDVETHKRYKTAAKADHDVKKKIVKKANKGLYLLPHDEGKFERDVKKRKAGIKMVKKKLVKEEKGDRVVPGSLSPETMKQVQDLSRDLASGERGATFALKGNPTKTINVSSDAPERGNKVGTRAPLNEKHLTPPEKAAKEKIVLKMKPHLAKFKKRYGKESGEGVMYGVATNRAKQVAEEKKDTVLVSPKGYKGGGKVKRINKKDYDPKKHSLASE